MPSNELTWDKKGVALNPQSQIHYMDHLAVISILMDIPLLLVDEECDLLARRYYPGLKTLFKEYGEFNPDYLMQNYDVSFMSDLWDRRTMKSKFAPLEERYKKTWRNVHCPHGFSDKGYYLCKAAMEDIVLLYGNNMIDQMKYYGVWENFHRYVICGNYRHSFYKQHKSFYDTIFKQEIQSRFDKERPLVLYAPTWVDSEQSSSFFEAGSAILDALPGDYNIIVKLHERLELDDVVNYHKILGKHESKSNVLFLSHFPLVFPLLAHADFYIGDMSSVGYDFLAFDKPLFLLNKQNRQSQDERSGLLFHCATEIKPDQHSEIFKIIEKSIKNDAERLSALRRQMWEYTFGAERSFAEIKADIINACSAPIDESLWH